MSQSTRISGARLWLCTAVLVVAVLAAFRSMTTVVQSGPWVTTGTAGLALLALLLVLLRLVLRSPLAPTAWGLLAAVIGVAGQYGGLTSTFTVPRPTAETVERLRLLIAQGEQTIVEGRIPVQPTRGLEMLLVIGVLATYLGAELVAVGLGRGGLTSLLHGLAEDELDLAVDAAQLVGRPGLELGPELGVDAEQEGFAFLGHDSGSPGAGRAQLLKAARHQL